MRYTRFLLTLAAIAYFWHCYGTYADFHFIDSANLIFHEAGHTIFFFLGQFVRIAAGSGFQVALPLGIAAYFFAKGERLSGSIVLLWAGESMLNVAVYAGDAVRMRLDLLGGDAVIHDWNYILGALHMLARADQVAAAIYWLGFASLAVGTALALNYSWPWRSSC